jgi:hypothetical protein
LRDKIHGKAPQGWRERYDAIGTEELLPGETDPGAASINVYRPGDTAGA